MGVPNKQIGWSQEANLLWRIAKILEQLQGIAYNSGGGGSTAVFTATTNGLVPAPGVVAGKVLADNGTWISNSAITLLVADTATIDMTLAVATLSADLKNTSVVAGIYGDATTIPTITVDAQGRLTSVVNTLITLNPTQVANFNEAAQDAVGSIMTATPTISLIYNDGAPTITANVIPGSIGVTEIGYVPANDANVVHKTGVESIAGVKTFSAIPVVPALATPLGTGTQVFLDNGTMANFTLADKTEWKGNWAAGTYLKNQQVLDNSFLMIANKTTTDRPAPQPLGAPAYVYKGTIGSTVAVGTKQVIFGNRYTFNYNALIEGWRINLVAGNNYIVYLVENPLGAAIISQVIQFTAQNSGWQSLNLSKVIVTAGSTYDLGVTVNEPAVPVTIVTGIWSYAKPTNTTASGNGQAKQANTSPSILTIGVIDSGAIDHTAFFATLNIGDVIECDGTRWSIQSTVNNGTYYTFTVSPATQLKSTGNLTFRFEAKPTTTITYPLDVNYWTNFPPVNITTQGFLAVGVPYSAATISGTAYGIDLLVSEIVASPDWDIQAISGLTGPGGGSNGVIEVIAGSNIAVDATNPLAPVVSGIPGTSAGVFDRVYFTGQVSTVVLPNPPALNYDTLRTGKGSVALVTLTTPALASGAKAWLPNDMVGPSQIIASALPLGNYSAFLTTNTSSSTGTKNINIEVFLCDAAGNIIPQAGPPSTDTNPFYAGKNTVTILTSGFQTLLSGDNRDIGLSAYLTAPLNVAIGQRFRYHFSVQRNVSGGNATTSILIGNSVNSYIEAPVPINTTTVVNSSAVSGATATDALNSLNTNKQNTITGGATSIVTANLTASRALVSDGSGKVAVSGVTSAELGYLTGVTNSIQSQINTKVSTGGWIDYSLTSVIVGWASYTNRLIMYKIVDDMLYCMFTISGVSNNSLGSFTLPSNNTSGLGVFTLSIGITSNSVTQGTPGRASIAAGSNIVNLSVDGIGNGFATINNKTASGQFFYKIN